jgi:diguanylate cyclase (GGDEF)-like protein/PAS domain S-box-containing protein
MDRSARRRARARLASIKPGEAAIVPITGAEAEAAVEQFTADAAHAGTRKPRLRRWPARWASFLDAERERAQRAIEESRRRLTEAERIANLGSFELDMATGELNWSEGQYHLLGIDTSVTPTTERFRRHVHPDDRALVDDAWADVLGRGEPIDLVCRMVTVDGRTRVVHARAVPTTVDDQVVRVNGTIADVTDRVQSDHEREVAEMRFAVGFEQSATGTVIADLDGRPTMVNPAMCRFLDRRADELVGRRWDELSQPDDVALGAAAMHRIAVGDDQYIDERRYLRPDGGVVWALATVALVRDTDGEPAYYFAQFQDITERRTMEAELRHQALHDSLTGLPNRTLLVDRVTQALARARRRGTSVGVVFLDLDHFKLVNDALGHAVGDLLLVAVADRLAGVVRPNDTVARLGGDEFVVLCEDDEPREFAAVASCIGASFDEPVVVRERELHVTASLGVVTATDEHTADDLLRDADVAMYRAKTGGRARIQVFDEHLRREAAARFDGEAAMRRGIAAGEFCVFYQPIVSVVSGALVGVEALLRWRDPQRGLVSPAEFIPLAEETGLIVPLGRQALDMATRQVQQWRLRVEGCEDMFVAVNLSARQLEEVDLIADVEAALAASRLPPHALHLEITETVVMGDVERSIAVLAQLRALGVRLAIDDFGTGYSSLGYLKRLPLDTLKIDRSFVEGLGAVADVDVDVVALDDHGSSITRAIVNLGNALDLELLAEGVETEAQLAALVDLGCQLAQGYLWSPPIDAEQFPRWLATARAARSPEHAR